MTLTPCDVELEELEVQNEAEAFLSESALLGSEGGRGVQEELWIRCSRLVAQRRGESDSEVLLSSPDPLTRPDVFAHLVNMWRRLSRVLTSAAFGGLRWPFARQTCCSS